ncbi:hypothetical protein JW824_12500 [bacterium]|nr:hypothetical protein [bacterium]RQV92096.1 MAG: hypothetical protein EH221_12510 [bacterium]
MKYTKNGLILLIMLVSISMIHAQAPEEQYSFAQVPKSHTNYVTQAELWWKEIEKDPQNENSWYHYFRACRNAHATAGWSNDFVNESPFLRRGNDILALMEIYIPDTFTTNFAMWLNDGFNPEKGPYLLKAYKMNPDFQGIHATMITYADSEFDFELRKDVNQKWFSCNEMSPGLLAYGYNVLESLEPQSILFTQHDNDTYPLWMLQDVKNIRTDVTVINFDMLLIKSYREKVFDKYQIGHLDRLFEESNPVNLESILNHIIAHYENSRPFFIGLSVTPAYYENFSDRFFVSGLTLKYSDTPLDMIPINQDLYENKFLLDYLKIQMTSDPNQNNVDKMNLNYFHSFQMLYDHYLEENQSEKADKIKELTKHIIQNAQDPVWMERFEKAF